MGVTVTRPPEHLVDDRLDEEDEEEAETEEQLRERILKLQHCCRHHAQTGSSFQGFPHLVSEKMKESFFQIFLSYLAQHVDEYSGDEDASAEA